MLCDPCRSNSRPAGVWHQQLEAQSCKGRIRLFGPCESSFPRMRGRALRLLFFLLPEAPRHGQASQQCPKLSEVRNGQRLALRGSPWALVFAVWCCAFVGCLEWLFRRGSLDPTARAFAAALVLGAKIPLYSNTPTARKRYTLLFQVRSPTGMLQRGWRLCNRTAELCSGRCHPQCAS